MFKQHCGRFIQVYITVVWILDLVKLDPINTFGLSMKVPANWGCCLSLFYLLIICLFCWFVFICLVWKLYKLQIRTSKSQMWLTVFKQLFCPTNSPQTYRYLICNDIEQQKLWILTLVKLEPFTFEQLKEFAYQNYWPFIFCYTITHFIWQPCCITWTQSKSST